MRIRNKKQLTRNITFYPKISRWINFYPLEKDYFQGVCGVKKQETAALSIPVSDLLPEKKEYDIEEIHVALVKVEKKLKQYKNKLTTATGDTNNE